MKFLILPENATYQEITSTKSSVKKFFSFVNSLLNSPSTPPSTFQPVFTSKTPSTAKNFKQVIEWTGYDKFEGVEYLAKGGFGTTYKAVWKDGPWDINNAGKNSITKDPKTNNFMMVMQLKNGSLGQHLNNNFISLNWKKKLHSLTNIALGLVDIHNK
ncbi:unnamed protein product [Rhizophagus irregularis]|nr:unnamed protein product [Rhizophagus irregularis]